MTQLVEKVGDVIGDWLSGAKKSMFGKEILDTAESTTGNYSAGSVKKRYKENTKSESKHSGKAVKHPPLKSKSKDTDIKIILDEEDARKNGDSMKSKSKQKKRRNYFGSKGKDRPKGGRNSSSERSEEGASRDDSQHDGAGRKIFVCSGMWIPLFFV